MKARKHAVLRWALASAALLLTACQSPQAKGNLSRPPDAELEQRFRENRAGFEELATMSQQDSRLIRVASSFLTVMEPGGTPRGGTEKDLPPQRWSHYRELFRQCGLSDGLLAERSGASGVYFPALTRQAGADSMEKGWTRLDAEPAEAVSSLDSFDVASRRPKAVFKRIDGNWYLYARYNE